MSELLDRAFAALDAITPIERTSMRSISARRVAEAQEAVGQLIGQQRPLGWQPAKYDIALAHVDQPREVYGIRHAEWLLGIHVNDAGWSDVTHIPTGQRIATFKALGSALAFTSDIAPVYNWRLPVLIIEDHIERMIRAYVNVHS